MRRRRLQLAAVVAVLGLLGVVAAAVAGGGSRDVREHLTGYAEVAETSRRRASGEFRAKVRDNEIEYKLSYGELEGDVTQAHIHLGREADAAGSACSCAATSERAGGDAGVPPARARHGARTIKAADVIGPAGQGIAPGEFGELLRAIRAGVTYANVHTTKYPAGEIRAQLERRRGH